jgi:transcriptional regulator of acetoin/glycerol metabolism
MPHSTLLVAASGQDPNFLDVREDAACPGPILTALAERRFDRVVIFWRPQRREQAERTAAIIAERHPRVTAELQALELNDPHHHPEVWAKLRAAVRRARARAPQDVYALLLTSDTPEIHACGVLLVLSGELTARLLNFRRGALREVRWRDPSAMLDPSMQALLSDQRSGLYQEAAIVQAGQASERIFTPRSMETAALLAKTIAPVLIQSEPGTQKTLFAGMLHQLSQRDGPLVIFNCGTVPPELAAVALFGEAEPEGRIPGKLQLAEGGTLVLMKFQKLAEELQLAILRAAEDGEFTPVHSRVSERFHARICVTTDLDLANEVTCGRMNPEVFRRLRIGLVRLPPLRERSHDLPHLIRDEMERANRRQPRPKRLSAAALTKLESHHWPSNLSELRRVIERAFLNSDRSTVEPEDIEFDLSTNLDNHFTPAAPRIRRGFSIEEYLRGVKHELVRIALRKSHGNQSEAARMLGVTPQAVNKFLRPGRPGSAQVRR